MSASASVAGGSESVRGNNSGVDRLSSLSDELLHHMMSFLPMPEVVRTSLLSPRWRSLWASTPFINIHYQDFKDEDSPSFVDQDKLEKFWNNLLLLRDGTVCLDWARISVTFGTSRTSSVWIRHAIKHKVRFLYIDGFFDYPTLDSTAMFPSQHLKRIWLRSLSLSHGFFKLLNHECLGLEHLELEDCILHGLKEISSMSLQVLRIIACVIPSGLLIRASNLTHLSILDPVCDSGAIVTRNLSSLVAASVILSSYNLHCFHPIVDGYRLLDGLSHATTLELQAPLHELAFETSLQTCPMFSNLTSLVLGDWCMAADFYPLLRILECSNKLKELNIKLKMEECSYCMDSKSAMLSSSGTSLTTGSYPPLERIKIFCRKDDPRVGVLVQVLLPIINPDRTISIKRC